MAPLDYDSTDALYGLLRDLQKQALDEQATLTQLQRQRDDARKEQHRLQETLKELSASAATRDREIAALAAATSTDASTVSHLTETLTHLMKDRQRTVAEAADAICAAPLPPLEQYQPAVPRDARLQSPDINAMINLAFDNFVSDVAAGVFARYENISTTTAPNASSSCGGPNLDKDEQPHRYHDACDDWPGSSDAIDCAIGQPHIAEPPYPTTIAAKFPDGFTPAIYARLQRGAPDSTSAAPSHAAFDSSRRKRTFIPLPDD